MALDSLKSLFKLAEISSPVALYLFLLVFMRIILEKINFLKSPPFENIFPFIKNILHVFIFIISLIFSLGIFGIDVQGLIAGLGLFSFALGFALKDVISNFLAGVSILLYGPFKIGDIIRIDAYRGKVVKMDIRYTVLEWKTTELKQEFCFVPNSYLMGTKIIIESEHLKNE